jgi:glycosyltransferase involved in cell wall biosynthesis
MRIAYVCSDPGIPIFGCKGASIHAQAVLQVLHRHGHEIHLVTPRPGGESSIPLVLHRLPAVSGGPTAARERSAQHSDASVADILTAVQPDLVYERYSLWGETATRWAKAQDVPSVLEVNAPLVEEQATYRELVDRFAAEQVARSALSRAGAVVCVSDGVADWARTVSTRPDRVRTIPNGVDTERIRPAARPVTPAVGQDFTVGFVGTLKPWHGLENLVAAVARLVEAEQFAGRASTWRLLVVGDGPLRDSITQLADELGIADRVELTGAVPAEGVAAQLQRMDVACAPYPAQSRFYFSPLKIYEYLAAGLPVVASVVGQVPEALDHGRLGPLVPPGDVAALAEGLRTVRDDHARRIELRQETRDAAVTRHTWTAVVQRALALAHPERVEAA